MDLRDRGVTHAIVFADQETSKLPGYQVILDSLSSAGVRCTPFTDVRVEPTRESFEAAAVTARTSGADGVVAFGGGSVIDTAKAAALFSRYPTVPSGAPDGADMAAIAEDTDGVYAHDPVGNASATSRAARAVIGDFLAYVNPPVGRGLPVPGPLPPLIAIPTTVGTGSEATGIAIFDTLVAGKDGSLIPAKTGIGSRLIKPALGLVDSDNVQTLPRGVVLASGLDVLCHALESYTAIPFTHRGLAPSRPALRPAYQGSNPMADLWVLHSLRELAAAFGPALGGDPEAKGRMHMAAAYAGVGFGSAGVHACHGMSYAVSSGVKTRGTAAKSDEERAAFTPEGFGLSGYPDKPLCPHGVSVAISAPAVFEWTEVADPDRHVEVAKILSKFTAGDGTQVIPRMLREARTAGGPPAGEAGERLADVVRALLQHIGAPNGLGAFGYTLSDLPDLVQGTLPQQRVLALAPRKATAEALNDLFEATLRVY